MYKLVGTCNSHKAFEIALLMILTASGIMLVLLSEVPANEWFLFDSTARRSVSVKLALLVLIAIFRWSIQYSIIPKLKSGETNVLPLIYHAVIITLLSALLLLSSFAL